MTVLALSAAAMRELDRRTIAAGIKSGAELMESAARAVTDAVLGLLPPGGGRVLAVCGKGNNGGDGLAVARQLREAGNGRVTVELVTVCALADYHGDAGIMAEKLPPDLQAGVGRELAAPARADVIVDALLGTGFAGGLRPPYGEWIARINAARAENPRLRVVAVDLPSGLNADDGTVAETAVRADLTVTFHCPKIGMLLPAAREYCGVIKTADIGIPYAGGENPAR